MVEQGCDLQPCRQSCLHLRQQFLDAADNVERRRFTVFQHGQQCGTFAVLPDDVDLRREAKADLRDILHVDAGAVGGADRKIVERGDLSRRGVEFNHPLAVAEASGSRGEDQILLVDGERDIGR